MGCGLSLARMRLISAGRMLRSRSGEEVAEGAEVGQRTYLARKRRTALGISVNGRRARRMSLMSSSLLASDLRYVDDMSDNE